MILWDARSRSVSEDYFLEAFVGCGASTTNYSPRRVTWTVNGPWRLKALTCF